MIYQETSLKRDIILHGILSGKLSAVLQAAKGRSVTIQELPHSKTAEANSKNSESTLNQSPSQYQGALFCQKSLFSDKTFIQGYPNACNQVAFCANINPGVLATFQFK